MDFKIVPFDSKKHNSKGFDCGVQALNEYLMVQADEDIRTNATRLFVAITLESNDILGYYTLSNTGVDKRSFPEDSGLPRYADVPSILLGRLAVHRNMQGKGLGMKLMANAIIKGLEDTSAWAVMVVDPKDPKETQVSVEKTKVKDPADFYINLGFQPLKKKGKQRLYGKRKDLEALVEIERDVSISKQAINILVSAEIKEQWEIVAKAKGITLADFSINAMNDAAQRFFAEQKSPQNQESKDKKEQQSSTEFLSKIQKERGR